MITVSPRPEHFRTATQFHNECGPYQLRAALNTFGKDALPEELYYSAAHRRRDWSIPWLMPGILRRYGVTARTHFWLAGSFKKRVLAMLKRDQPVLFVLHSIRGAGRLHWMSIWGYDETTDEFLCYDSQGPEASGTPGNVRYSASLLRSRLPWHGTFVLAKLSLQSTH